MRANAARTMRDAFLERIHGLMHQDRQIFLVSDDFGSPVLDKIRGDFGERFINVGIAEQNCINVATGLALEGFTVFAYGIAGFMSMRAYEQVRTNASLASQLRPINLNIVGVGAGLSYDVSGPSHHCLEDLTLLRLLPNVEVFSPSDWELATRLADYSVAHRGPKYLRFDSKPTPRIYGEDHRLEIATGFHELARGERICLVSTGFMTHVALDAARQVGRPVGVVDVFGLKPKDEHPLCEVLRPYGTVITIEEGFINRGGLDSYICNVLVNRGLRANFRRLGVDDRYLFELGGRDRLHRLCGMDRDAIVRAVAEAAC